MQADMKPPGNGDTDIQANRGNDERRRDIEHACHLPLDDDAAGEDNPEKGLATCPVPPGK